MKINAKKTIITQECLTIRPTNSGNYPYALIAESGETVGWLREFSPGIYRVDMIDDSYDPEYTILSQGSLRKLQEEQQSAS